MPSGQMKLYCYVNETGHDVESRVFIVATVVIDSERETVRKALANIKKASRKGLNKWTRPRLPHGRPTCSKSGDRSTSRGGCSSNRLTSVPQHSLTIWQPPRLRPKRRSWLWAMGHR